MNVMGLDHNPRPTRDPWWELFFEASAENFMRDHPEQFPHFTRRLKEARDALGDTDR